jgi:hypothetical protein
MVRINVSPTSQKCMFKFYSKQQNTDKTRISSPSNSFGQYTHLTNLLVFQNKPKSNIQSQPIVDFFYLLNLQK